MNNHVQKQAVQRETVCLPDAPALKAKSGLTGGTCGGASLIIDTKGLDAGLTHQTGQTSETEQANKLSLIRTLSQGEIEGWRAEIMRHEGRPFNGEAAALAAREKQIKGGR